MADSEQPAHRISITEVRVHFAQTISDRNYGNERAEVTMTFIANVRQSAEQCEQATADLLSRARALVTAELRRSPNEAVRRAMETEQFFGEEPGDEEEQEDVESQTTLDDDDDDDDDDDPF